MPYLYKFRNFNNPHHMRSITHSEVWFSGPLQFNDPFDCNIPIRVDKCPEEWQLQRMAEVALQRDPQLSLDEALAAARKELDNTHDVVQILHKHQMENVINPKTGVLPLAPYWREKRSKLIWAHYTESHTGFAVGFDQEVLLRWMREVSGAKPEAERHTPTPGLQIRPTQVTYVEKLPLLKPCEMSEAEIVLKLLTHKAMDWDYEEEWRLLLMKLSEEGHLMPLDKTDRAQQLPVGAIAEVILGAKVSPSNVDLIKMLLRRRDDSVRLYQARISYDKFDLERDELSY